MNATASPLRSLLSKLGAKPGDPYRRVRLHYANGEARDLELIHQVHGRDWWVDPRKRGANDRLPHPETTTGWERMTPDGYPFVFTTRAWRIRCRMTRWCPRISSPGNASRA